ncbi:MAG: energy transducer TonB [bacterium]
MAGRPLPKIELKQCKPQTDIGPRIKKARLPRYPAVKFFNNKVGEVAIKFDVTESGVTDNVEIIRSTSQGFRIQVISAVQNWSFVPARNAEIPTRVTCTQEHMFEKQ